MPNEYVNHVIVNGVTKLDLRGDTITASSLAQGITAHDRSGAPIVGTGSGGIPSVTQDQDGYLVLDDDQGANVTVESLSVTQNGTYTAPSGKAYSPVTVNVSGGASNIVFGEFTAGTAGTVQEIEVDYSGNGWPIFISVFPKNGYNQNESLYSADHRYAVVATTMFKAFPNSSSAGATSAYGSYLYKSQATGMMVSATRINGYNTFGTQADPAADGGSVAIRDKNSFAVLVSDTSYGFLSGIVYKYVIVYSS